MDGIAARARQSRASLLIGGGLLLLLVAGAAAAPLLAPYPLQHGDLAMLPPSPKHPLGTNDMGYDILSELLHAGRISLLIGFSAAFFSVVVGGMVGVAAGYLRGLLGDLLVAVIDLFLLVPMLPLMILIVAHLGQGWSKIVLVIGLLGWCSTARAVRSKVLQVREALFIEALRSLGIGGGRVFFFHLLPHVREILAAKFALAVGAAMLGEASLSFLGLGDSTSITWGMMMHYAFTRGGFSSGMWYWYLFPGLCIGASVLAFALIGMHFEENPAASRGNGPLAVDV